MARYLYVMKQQPSMAATYLIKDAFLAERIIHNRKRSVTNFLQKELGKIFAYPLLPMFKYISIQELLSFQDKGHLTQSYFSY